MSPHVLRHTCATLSRDAGARLEDIQDQLGHAVRTHPPLRPRRCPARPVPRLTASPATSPADDPAGARLPCHLRPERANPQGAGPRTIRAATRALAGMATAPGGWPSDPLCPAGGAAVAGNGLAITPTR
nr:site-specific integrase [Micromonospora olivasterospora]